jgi:hypothetical protein
MMQFVKNNSKYLTVAGAFSLLIISYFQRKENVKLRLDTKAKQAVIDSLSSEIFTKQIEVGRYEVMWERITELYPESVDKIEHEVE